MPGSVEKTCTNVKNWKSAELWWLLISDPPGLARGLMHIPNLLLPWQPRYLGAVEDGNNEHQPLWMPSLDLAETKDALMVKVETPGIDPKDIQVTLQENLLTIKGEKKHEKEEKDERHHRVERSYGAFTRTVRLPVAVDGGKVDAKFKNGLLTVTLPKTPGAKGTTVPVKAE